MILRCRRPQFVHPSLSLSLSLRTLRDKDFSLSCGPWKMDGIYPVELEERCHKFGRSLEYAPLEFHHDETWSRRSDMVLMHNSFMFALYLLSNPPLACLQIHRANTLYFLFFRTHFDDEEVSFWNLANCFRIYFRYASMVAILFPWIIE